jgi:hypothetical protein
MAVEASAELLAIAATSASTDRRRVGIVVRWRGSEQADTAGFLEIAGMLEMVAACGSGCPVGLRFLLFVTD